MPAGQGRWFTPRASLPTGFLCLCSEGVTRTSGNTGAATNMGRGKSVRWATSLRQGPHLPALLMQEPGEGDGQNNPLSPPFASKLVSPTDHEILHCQVPRELQNWGTTTVGRDLRVFQSSPADSRAKLEWVALCLPLPRAKNLQLCRLTSLGLAPEPNHPCGEIFFLIPNWNFPCVLLALILPLCTCQQSPAPASLPVRSCWQR